jgi:hypothetical protein
MSTRRINLPSLGNIIFNPAFEDLIQGEYFIKSPCLCCFETKSPAAYKSASLTIATIAEYHDIKSKKKIETSDLTPCDIMDARTHIKYINFPNPRIHEINKRLKNMCISAPLCKPNVVWIFSNPPAKRLLKNLLAQTGENLTLSTRLLNGEDIIQYPYFKCFELSISYTIIQIDLVDYLADFVATYY